MWIPEPSCFGGRRNASIDGARVNSLLTRSDHPSRAEPNPKLGLDDIDGSGPHAGAISFLERRQDRARRLRRDGTREFPDVGKFQTPARLLPHCARLEAQPFPSALATSALRWPSSERKRISILGRNDLFTKNGHPSRVPRSIHSVLTDVLDGSGRRIPGAILRFGDGSKIRLHCAEGTFARQATPAPSGGYGRKGNPSKAKNGCA
jgi:hypothetical protein